MAPAFTLVELLVTIAVIAILAGLLLPVLVHSKHKARMSKCLSNLHQAGAGMLMYVQDCQDKFPPALVNDTDGLAKYLHFGLGGRDPRADDTYCFASAAIRPLAHYVRAPETFRCTEDKGLNTPPCMDFTLPALKPTCWESAGCSYVYNIYTPWWPYYRTHNPGGDPTQTIDGKQLGWVPDPTRFILMHEPPARSYRTAGGPPPCIFSHWHESSDIEVVTPDVKKDTHKFISPMLFVDGHVARHDFTRTIQADPDYIYEPTKDCMWYKPQ